ncbi:hypothetical protein [Pseudomonas aeruginosa]|uniref:hypothetical protein n=1 Tax=Pseudomonas aeruginosa TaxID=287 RepID=UPI00071BB680|nr:hypothetical protein [Pseudomonas aeruginosa]KSM29014.1 hypothetical protein APA64_18610 [Pseudomonas aeruginosa]MBG4920742.1 hypothetical protein [Pseudomonas aeruginosa]MCT5365718.1 hypothetical protein [Pseudomonas aeruginosa]PBV07912.1 hypothetical protein CJU35_11170 [Pseudomonas aeruginosa]
MTIDTYVLFDQDVLKNGNIMTKPEVVAELNRQARAATAAATELEAWRELRKAVADIEGCGDDWPSHGNVPLAIAAGYALLKRDLSSTMTMLAEVETMVRMIEEREWAEHVGQSDIAQRLEAIITRLVNEARPPHSQEVPQAWLDVQAERKRQVEAEGWTPEHDDEHACDEIAAFACFYAMPPAARDWDTSSTGYGDTLGEAILPEGWEPKTGDRRRELVKAAALILAEIERLDRAASLLSQEVPPCAEH